MLQTYFSHAPWLQIIVSAVVYFGIGAVWYAPPVFGNYWGAAHKIDMTNKDEARKQMPRLFATTFVLTFLMVLVLGLLFAKMGTVKCVPGIEAGLCISGFIAAALGINYSYLQKPFKLWVIDSGYHAVGLALSGAILAAWH